MNREIKFRAWDGKGMDDDFFINNEGVAFDYAEKTYDTPNLEIEKQKDFILMQFTGLKDKNGTDIYEGDIVELEVEFQGVSNNHYEQEGFHVLHTGEVSFIPSRGFHLKINKSWDLDNDEAWINPKIKDIVQYRSKVIGNIHQNPELL